MPSLAAPPATAPGPGPDARSQQYLEQAAAAGVLDLDEPETLVVADVPQADGGLFSCTAWTPGAARLGDHIDRLALAGRLDACSWIEILDRHSRTAHHGQTVIRTYRLRPVLADVEAGHRGSENLRANLARLLAADAARDGRPPLPAPGIPSWVGVGPRLWHGHHHGAIGTQHDRRDATPGPPVGQHG